MARLIGPDEASRLVYTYSPRQLGTVPQNTPAVMYTDAALTSPANILALDGSALPGSSVAVDAYSKLPLFQFPDGIDTLWTSIKGGPSVPIYARTDDRIDTVTAGLAKALVGGRNPILKGVPVVLGSTGQHQTTSNATVGTSRVPYYLACAATDLRLTYVNWFASSTSTNPSDSDNIADLVVNASIEYAGTIYRVTFGGQTTATISPGGFRQSEPLGLDLPAGALIYVRTFTSGSSWHANRTAYIAGAGGWTVTTDLTAPGSGAIPDNTSFTVLLGPDTVHGTPLSTVQPSVFVIGDSLAFGSGDGPSTWNNGKNTVNPKVGSPGFIGRACDTAGIGYLSIASPGDSGYSFLTANGHVRRMILATAAATAICEYGRNDITNSRTQAQVQADLLAIWGMLTGRGLRTFQTTITPKTTSTDGWLTTANQTLFNAGQETIRTTVNDWIRDGAPTLSGVAVTTGSSAAGTLRAGQSGHPLYGYFETADAVESSRNSGLWKAPANVRAVADGAGTSGQFNVTSATAAFTSADLGRTVTVVGAGAAGGLFIDTIVTITNGTTVQVQPTSVGTTASSAVLTVGDWYTQDGTHPQPYAAAAMAAAVSTANFI